MCILLAKAFALLVLILFSRYILRVSLIFILIVIKRRHWGGKTGSRFVEALRSRKSKDRKTKTGLFLLTWLPKPWALLLVDTLAFF